MISLKRLGLSVVEHRDWLSIAFISSCLIGCASTQSTSVAAPPSSGLVFEDDFEVGGQFDDLFPRRTNYRWTNFHRTHAGNSITFSTAQRNSGRQSLKFAATGANRPVSKSSLRRDGHQWNEGEIVTISADIFVDSTRSIENLFLMDIECASCWPKNSRHKNQSPGIRLAVLGSSQALAVERGKIGLRKGTLRSTTPFPKQRWVNVVWRIGLSSGSDGWTEVHQDQKQILRGDGETLPSAERFRRFGVPLVTPVFYESLEIGVTANVTKHDINVYFDNLTIMVSGRKGN